MSTPANKAERLWPWGVGPIVALILIAFIAHLVQQANPPEPYHGPGMTYDEAYQQYLDDRGPSGADR